MIELAVEIDNSAFISDVRFRDYDRHVHDAHPKGASSPEESGSNHTSKLLHAMHMDNAILRQSELRRRKCSTY